MHAIVEIAGKQFRVTNNQKVKVPLLAINEGEKVNFDKVLCVEDDNGIPTFGNPVLTQMSVDATVVEHGRDKKVIVFKKKRRKGYQKKNGHRQDYSLIQIDDISSVKAAPKKAAAEKVQTEEVKSEKPVEKKVTAKKTTAKPKSETAKTAKPATEKKAAKPKAATKKAKPKAESKED